MHPVAEHRDIILNNGVSLPRVGLGTFRAKGSNVRDAVQSALNVGIRLLDTASIYKNEEDIAAVLREQGIRPEQVFITSKVSPYEQGTEAAEVACQAIFNRLPWVDLLLVHWPGAARLDVASRDNARLRHETWRVLERHYKAGRVRAVGVSNFSVAHLEQLLAIAEVRPAVNQIEVHPCYQQNEVRAYCRQQGIAVTAYASLGCGKLLDQPLVQELAAQHKKSPAQVLLRWGLQAGCAVIPKSVRPERINEFAEDRLLGWSLSNDEFQRLCDLPEEPKRLAGVASSAYWALPGLRDFDREGYAVLEAFLSPADIEALRMECAMVYEAALEAAEGDWGRDFVAQTGCIFETLPGCHCTTRDGYMAQRARWPLQKAVKDLLFGEKLRQLVQGLLGPESYLFNDQYIVKPPCSASSAFAWHHDSAWLDAEQATRYPYISVWCPLQDVSPENGTLVVRGQQSRQERTLQLRAGDVARLFRSLCDELF